MSKIDFSKVNEVFIEAIKAQAEERDAEPRETCLILFPLNKNGKGSYVTRCKIFSTTNAFEEEVVRLKKITMYDVLGHISKAILEVFKGEIFDHNIRLESKSGESVRNYPARIDYDKLECYIELREPNEQEKARNEEFGLNMNMIYDGNFLREYNMSVEFGDADLDEIKKEMN